MLMCTSLVTAAANPQPNGAIPMLIGAGAIAILILVPFFAISARRRMRKDAFRDSAASQKPGMVRFVFHRYSGFPVVTRQSKYDTILPIDDAEALLKKLVRHNLTWGLLVYGGVFVPIFTFFEWRAQKKRIAAARPGFQIIAPGK